MSGDTVTGGVSQQLLPNLAMHVDGVYTNLRDFARTQNINQPNPAIRLRDARCGDRAARIAALHDGAAQRARPLANWGNVTQLTANGWSDYRALYVRLDKRMSNRYMYLISYTRDWTTEQRGVDVSDYYHPDLDDGSGRPQAHARRERHRAAAVRRDVRRGVDDPDGAAVQRARGRRPQRRRRVEQRLRAGDDAQHGGSRQRGHREGARTGERVARGAGACAPIPASQLQSSDYNRFDIRVSRSIAIPRGRSVDLVAQVFNVFGRDNLIGGTGGTFINNALSNSFGTLHGGGAAAGSGSRYFVQVLNQRGSRQVAVGSRSQMKR